MFTLIYILSLFNKYHLCRLYKEVGFCGRLTLPMSEKISISTKLKDIQTLKTYAICTQKLTSMHKNAYIFWSSAHLDGEKVSLCYNLRPSRGENLL